MEFLKAFFGDKAITYDELVQAINAYNGDEKNKEKLIKMEMYDAYHALGGNGMITKMMHEIEELHLKKKEV